MTSRERMKALLNHQPTDRIPNGLGGCETTGLHNLAYHNFKRILGVSDTRNRVCTFMNNAIFEPSVIEAMGGDTILLGSRMCPSRFWGEDACAEWKPLRLWNTDLQVATQWSFRQDSDGAWWWDDRTKCPPGALYFDPPAQAPSESVTGSQIAKPLPSDFNPTHDIPEQRLIQLQQQAQLLHDTTSLSIVCGEMIDDLQLQPGGTQAWWMRMVEEPDACHEFLGKACDAAIAQLRQLHDAVGAYCDMLAIAHDLGDSRGITIGPRLWRSIYKPHYQRLFTEWHKITGMKVAMHTCGAVSEILDDLIECGVDVYNPVQASARNMDLATLKQRFGDRLIFWGGSYDTVLNPASTEEQQVYETVRANIQVLSAGGGYIFAGVHNLPGDIPEAHLRAILQAWQDAR